MSNPGTRFAFWLLLVVTAAGIFLIAWRGGRDPKRDYERIEREMNYEDVAALLQTPPGDYRLPGDYLETPAFLLVSLDPPDLPREYRNRGPLDAHVWCFDEGVICIHCDEEKKVVSKGWLDAERAFWLRQQPTFWQRCRQWLGI